MPRFPLKNIAKSYTYRHGANESTIEQVSTLLHMDTGTAYVIRSGKALRFNNPGNTEYVSISISGGTDLIIENAITLGDLYLDTLGVMYHRIGGVEKIRIKSDEVWFRSLSEIRVYNVGNSEYGIIKRDNDYLYLDGGTGGDINIKSHTLIDSAKELRFYDSNIYIREDGSEQFEMINNSATAGILIQTGTMGIVIDGAASVDLQVGSSSAFACGGSANNSEVDIQILNGSDLNLFNAGDTEKASIYRDDNYMYLKPGTGATAVIVEAGDLALSSDKKLFLEGVGSDTYLVYNSGTSKVELYVNNVKEQEWG
jgi:hypothetical protein